MQNVKETVLSTHIIVQDFPWDWRDPNDQESDKKNFLWKRLFNVFFDSFYYYFWANTALYYSGAPTGSMIKKENSLQTIFFSYFTLLWKV